MILREEEGVQAKYSGRCMTKSSQCTRRRSNLARKDHVMPGLVSLAAVSPLSLIGYACGRSSSISGRTTLTGNLGEDKYRKYLVEPVLFYA